MAFNVCVNCGTNLNHMLGVYEIEMENYKIQCNNSNTAATQLDSTFTDSTEGPFTYFNNLFFLKHNIDRICCRTFFISFLDYIPSNT